MNRPTRQQEYEQLLIDALAIAARSCANGDKALAKALADNWIEQATAEYAKKPARNRQEQPCGHC